MPKYANQFRITVGERAPRDAKHPYVKMNLEALQDAMRSLSKVGSVKLWLYLNKNVDNYVVDLSRAELTSHWGFSKDTYDSAKKELIAAGYLVPVDNSNTLYTFYEAVKSENPTKVNDLSENPPIELLSENPPKSIETSENPTEIGTLSENPTIVYSKDFVF
jgi:hypothetical protein